MLPRAPSCENKRHWSTFSKCGTACVVCITTAGMHATTNHHRTQTTYMHLPQALEEMGVSKRKSAVPSSDATMAAVFSAPPLTAADLHPILHPDPATPAPPQGLLQRAASAWPRGDAYFFRTLAVQQRLAEAVRAPSKDLSAAEVAACVHMTAHLVYMQRQARAMLGQGSAALAAVVRVAGPEGGVVEQGGVAAWWACVQEHVPKVDERLRWGALLLQQTALPLTHAGTLQCGFKMHTAIC